MDILRCRSCGADIYWIETAAGKKHPINAKPKKMWVQQLSVGSLGQTHKIGIWKMEDAYESHFGTCPQSASWKKEVKDVKR